MTGRSMLHVTSHNKPMLASPSVSSSSSSSSSAAAAQIKLDPVLSSLISTKKNNQNCDFFFFRTQRNEIKFLWLTTKTKESTHLQISNTYNCIFSSIQIVHTQTPLSLSLLIGVDCLGLKKEMNKENESIYCIPSPSFFIVRHSALFHHHHHRDKIRPEQASDLFRGKISNANSSNRVVCRWLNRWFAESRKTS